MKYSTSALLAVVIASSALGAFAAPHAFAQTQLPPLSDAAMPGDPSMNTAPSAVGSDAAMTPAPSTTPLPKHKKHHRMHVSKRKLAHHSSHKAVASAGSVVKQGQLHLSHLGYYHGPIDGLNGPKTRAATKAFQREHGLKADGIIGKKTLAALIAADHTTRQLTALPSTPSAPPPPDFYLTHPDFYGHVDQQFSDPMLIARQHPQATQSIPSRYATVEVGEVVTGAMKRYTVTVNGTSELMVDNQPSVIGISSTYALATEDVVVLSTYNNSDPVCAYKTYLLTMHEGANELRPFDNCTRGYQASVKNNALYVVFPETEDARVVGATYKYEPGDLERL